MGSLYRITIHWTGGLYTPNEGEKEHYHFLVDGDGVVHKGNHKPEDNISCNDGNYAQHCGGGNTGNIGVSICSMFNKDVPIKRIQLEAVCRLVAELSLRYGIPVGSKTIFTHSEFGNTHPETTSHGKIDIDYLPTINLYDRDIIGNWLRNKITWYRQQIKSDKIK